MVAELNGCNFGLSTAVRFSLALLLLCVYGSNRAEATSPESKNEVTSLQPTLAIRLHTSALEFLSSIGHKIVEKELPRAEFPPVSINITGGPGSGRVDVTNLRIPKFESPRFNFQLSPPNGIFFRSHGGAVKVTGDWAAEYQYVIKWTTSGWVEVVATDVRSQLTIGVYRLGNKPQLRVYNCTADVGQLQVDLGGGIIPWIVNLFRADLAEALKETLHDQFCITTRALIEEQLNQALRTLPDRLALTDTIFVNYLYTSNPRTTVSYIDADIYMDVVLQNQSCQLPPSPHALSTPTGSGEYMTSVWMSQRVVNCLLESLHESGRLEFIIDKDMDGKHFKTFLATECRFYQLCIGKFFPSLAAEYPHAYVDFVLHSSTPANITIVGGINGSGTPTNGSGVRLETYFFLDFRISPWKQHPQVLARLAMNTNSTIQPQLFYNRIGGSMNETEINFVQISSTIGDFSQGFLNALRVVMKPLILVAADSSLRVGLPIPLVEGIRLANRARLTTLNEEIRVDADLTYAP